VLRGPLSARRTEAGGEFDRSGGTVPGYGLATVPGKASGTTRKPPATAVLERIVGLQTLVDELKDWVGDLRNSIEGCAPRRLWWKRGDRLIAASLRPC
jgi:hypothetical protein